MVLRIFSLTAVCWLAGIDWGLAAERATDPDDIVIHHDLRYRERPSKSWRLDLAMEKEASVRLAMTAHGRSGG